MRFMPLLIAIAAIMVLVCVAPDRAMGSASDIEELLPFFRDINSHSEYFSLPRHASKEDTLVSLELQKFISQQSDSLSFAVLLVQINETRRAEWRILPESESQPERRSLEIITNSSGSIITCEVLDVLGTC
ncbi:MAG: hypothetical protein GY835_07535 [bacterium]|nr:hypothetical protein [bacterium]